MPTKIIGGPRLEADEGENDDMASVDLSGNSIPMILRDTADSVARPQGFGFESFWNELMLASGTPDSRGRFPQGPLQGLTPEQGKETARRNFAGLSAAEKERHSQAGQRRASNADIRTPSEMAGRRVAPTAVDHTSKTPPPQETVPAFTGPIRPAGRSSVGGLQPQELGQQWREQGTGDDGRPHYDWEPGSVIGGVPGKTALDGLEARPQQAFAGQRFTADQSPMPRPDGFQRTVEGQADGSIRVSDQRVQDPPPPSRDHVVKWGHNNLKGATREERIAHAKELGVYDDLVAAGKEKAAQGGRQYDPDTGLSTPGPQATPAAAAGFEISWQRPDGSFAGENRAGERQTFASQEEASGFSGMAAPGPQPAPAAPAPSPAPRTVPPSVVNAPAQAREIGRQVAPNVGVGNIGQTVAKIQPQPIFPQTRPAQQAATPQPVEPTYGRQDYMGGAKMLKDAARATRSRFAESRAQVYGRNQEPQSSSPPSPVQPVDPEERRRRQHATASRRFSLSAL